MALFEPPTTHETDEILGSDAATRALSVTVVDNDLVSRVYENLASVYDFTFGPALHPGRVDAIQRMGIQPGDRVLEVGVGTGINVALYPRECAVTGIDLSGSMLEKARERVAREGCTATSALLRDGRREDEVRRRQIRHRLRAVRDQRGAGSGGGCPRNAPRLPPRRPHRHPESFPQPERGGAWLERIISPFTRYLGFKSDLDLPAFLVAGRAQADFNRKGERPADLVAGDCVKD